VGQGVFLGKRHVDPRQRGTLALIDAGEKKWDDGVFRISPVKVRWDGGAEPGECRRKIRRCGAGCRVSAAKAEPETKPAALAAAPAKTVRRFIWTPLARESYRLSATYRETKADPAAQPHSCLARAVGKEG